MHKWLRCAALRLAFLAKEESPIRAVRGWKLKPVAGFIPCGRVYALYALCLRWWRSMEFLEFGFLVLVVSSRLVLLYTAVWGRSCGCKAFGLVWLLYPAWPLC